LAQFAEQSCVALAVAEQLDALDSNWLEPQMRKQMAVLLAEAFVPREARPDVPEVQLRALMLAGARRRGKQLESSTVYSPIRLKAAVRASSVEEQPWWDGSLRREARPQAFPRESALEGLRDAAALAAQRPPSSE